MPGRRAYSTSGVRREKQPKPDLRRKDNRIEAFICEKGEIIARGLGVFEEDTLGLYDIHVNREHRRKGAGTAICRALMEEGFRNGAKSAHLQVLSSNLEALLSIVRSVFRRSIFTGTGLKMDKNAPSLSYHV